MRVKLVGTLITKYVDMSLQAKLYRLKVDIMEFIVQEVS